MRKAPQSKGSRVGGGGGDSHCDNNRTCILVVVEQRSRHDQARTTIPTTRALMNARYPGAWYVKYTRIDNIVSNIQNTWKQQLRDPDQDNANRGGRVQITVF